MSCSQSAGVQSAYPVVRSWTKLNSFYIGRKSTIPELPALEQEIQLLKQLVKGMSDLHCKSVWDFEGLGARRFFAGCSFEGLTC